MASLPFQPPLSLSKNITFSKYPCCFGLTRRLRFISPQFMHSMQINENSCTNRLIRTQSLKSNDLSVNCEAKCIINWSVEAALTDECVIYVTGDPLELGTWDPDKSVPLSPSLFNVNIWQAQIEVPCGVNFKYNYIIKNQTKLWSSFYRRGPKLSLSTPNCSDRNKKEIHVRDCWHRDVGDRIRVPLWDCWLFGLTVFKDPLLRKNESMFDALFSAQTGVAIKSSKSKPKSVRSTEIKAFGTKKESFTENQMNGKIPYFKFLNFEKNGMKESGTGLPDLNILFSDKNKSKKPDLPKALHDIFSKQKPESSTEIKAKNKSKIQNNNSFSEEKSESISRTEIKAKSKSKIQDNTSFSKEKSKSVSTTEIKVKNESKIKNNNNFPKEKSKSSTEIKATGVKEKLYTNDNPHKRLSAEIKETFTKANLEIKNEPIEEPWYQNLVNSPKIEELIKEKEISQISKSDKIIHEIPEIPTKILINSSVCNMRRIAVLENEKLVELILAPQNDNLLNNNIYLGVIKKSLPKKWAAFVDVGLSEYIYMVLEKNREPFLYGSKKYEISINGGQNREIEANFRKGTKIIVQVSEKEAVGTDETGTVTLNPYPQIKSRFWILKTRNDKIELSDSDPIKSLEKNRLLKIAKKLKPDGFGLTVQSVASGRPVEELEKDLNILLSTWNKILHNAESAVRASKEGIQRAVPAMLYRTVDQDLSVIYDCFPVKVERVLVDSPRSYHEVTVDLQKKAPELCERVELYNKATPIFDEYKIEEEIDKILCKRVQLPDGGYIVIEQTEAFVSIDVNSGGSRTGENREKSCFEVNRAAAKQIARELRLRDIGGVIIVDFIDMVKESNKRLLYEEMKREVERDRSKVTISQVSSLGLIEITRERVHRTGSFMISEPCKCCHATGRVEALETCYSKIEREISRFLAASDQDLDQNQNQNTKKKDFVLKVDKHMCEYLTCGAKTRLDALKRSFKVRIHLEIERGFSWGKFELVDKSKSDEGAVVCEVK